MRPLRPLTLAVLTACMAFSAGVGADDGDLVRKSMSHEGNPPDYGGYVLENEHAFIKMMAFYVPSQAANGMVGEADSTEYYNIDEVLWETRTFAKPLVGVYINGPFEEVEGVGFVGHGMRDAYGAISLDDGVTWKNTNLSESATETSQTQEDDVYRTDIDLFKNYTDDGAYPGDVVNIFHAVSGTKVLVAWPSRFCSSGQPNYSLDSDDPDTQARRAAIADYLDIDLATASYDDLYLVDMFRVAGQQGSVDYAEDKWDQNHVVGEVPFNCVWTARGQLVNGDDPRTEAIESTYMRWFKAERLTSGRRDANRIEVAAVHGAGFAMTWQEDPDGLRPGQGEGPGEGWSGAIGNSGTDIWYSYIDWEDFDVVQDPADATGATSMTFLAYEAAAATVDGITQKPKPFVPMSMPMAITDNAKCNVENPAPYCWGSALQGTVPAPTDSLGNELNPLDYGLKDMCAATVEIPTGPNDELKTICVSADGMPNVGNTASTRARLNLFGYMADGTVEVKTTDYDNAFVVVQVEEDKGLGRASFLDTDADGLPDGIEDGSLTSCEPVGEGDKTCISWDTGKNQRYHSFSMSLTDALATNGADGLVANLTFPGHLLNQPEVNWQTGEFFPMLNTSEVWDFGEYNFDLFNTEIARRGSLLAQDIYKVHDKSSDAKTGLVALPTWKQGQMNQGGPADVMSRRIVMKKNWKMKDGNPYAFRNMVCKNRVLTAKGANPYYPGGVCLDPAINLSATIPDTAIDTQTEEALDVATLYVDDDGIGTVNPILQGLVQGEGDTTKILTWHQCDADYTVVSASEDMTPVACGTQDSTLDDQSWYNAFDVAKGHRGFLDGDFVMMLYAWSPNWRLNTVGHDRYELYIRRSFDGAETWTTLPKNFKHWDGTDWDGDGTVVCETYRTDEQQQQGDSSEPRVCYAYNAGGFEQARNVTQHKSMRTTTLDPRYTATLPTITSDPFGYGIQHYLAGDGGSEDVRDPSRYFIVFETGDNTTTVLGEPEPLDLFYSRAVNFGDDYLVWAEETNLSVCYPSDPHDVDVPEELEGSGFCNEFDQFEQGRQDLEASEASLTANPGGEFLYGAWAQYDHEEHESDASVRRVWWIDGYISDNPENTWTLPGTNSPDN